MVCAAMQRDEGGCFPPVRVLTRDDVIAFLLHDGLVQTTQTIHDNFSAEDVRELLRGLRSLERVRITPTVVLSVTT